MNTESAEYQPTEPVEYPQPGWRTIVYKFGLRPPHEGAELLHAQLLEANRYRNALVEIERARRAACRKLESTAGDLQQAIESVRSAESALEQAIARVARERHEMAKERIRQGLDPKNRGESAEAKAIVKAARGAHKDAARAAREIRMRVKFEPHIVAERDRINAEAKEANKSARAAGQERGGYWGSRGLIDNACDQSFSAPLMSSDFEPNDPRFHRFRGEGAVGVQIPYGITLAQLAGGQHAQLRLMHGALPEPKRDGTPRRPGKKDHRVLWLRVGSNEDRSPVWAKWNLILHRPFPQGATIMRAAVYLRRVADAERWTVSFTLRLPEVVMAARRPKDLDDDPEEAREGAGASVAVDLRWTRKPDGVLAATWCGDDGEAGEIRMDNYMQSRLDKADSLRSIRDRNLESARATLVAQLAREPLPETPIRLPNGSETSLAKEAATLVQWRSAARLARFVRLWSAARYPGDADGFAIAEAWRAQDHHLWQWECHQRSRSLGARKELYRITAAKLSAAYARLVLEDLDLRELARKAPVEELDPAGPRAHRIEAAPGELRLALEQAFKREHGPAAIVVVRARGDGGPDGTSACESMLQDARERPGGEQSPGGARNTKKVNSDRKEGETKWQYAARRGADKRARNEGARKGDDKAAE